MPLYGRRLRLCQVEYALAALAWKFLISQVQAMEQNSLAWLAAYQTQLWSLGLVVFGAIVSRTMRLRPRLQYSVNHSANLLVEEPLIDPEGKKLADRQLVRTASIVVSNAGLQAAKNVEVAFNWKPPILNVQPPRAYTDLPSPFDRHSIKFDSFAPGEQVTISIMSINAELPVMTAVRSDDCQGKPISMQPQRVWPFGVNLALFALLIMGLCTTVYLLLTGISYLISK